MRKLTKIAFVLGLGFFCVPQAVSAAESAAEIVATFNSPSGNSVVGGLAIDGDLLAMGSNWAFDGADLISIANPLMPIFLGHFPSDSDGDGTDINIKGTTVYIINDFDQGGGEEGGNQAPETFRVVDFSNASNPQVTATPAVDTPLALHIRDDLLFVYSIRTEQAAHL